MTICALKPLLNRGICRAIEMVNVNFVLFFVAFVLTGTEASQHPWFKNAFVPVPKLYLSVYYESNCPDSKSFILNQLKPAAKLLHKHLIVRLVPFGKSKSYDSGFGGFDCQHGQAECLGNMVQDCTLYNMIMGRTDLERINYVACEMETYAASKGSLECAEKAGIPAGAVRECMVNGIGIELQLTSEYLTNLVKPKYIPTVVFDGTFEQEIQDIAQVDLMGALCSRLRDTTPCANYYNNIAMNVLLREGSIDSSELKSWPIGIFNYERS